MSTLLIVLQIIASVLLIFVILVQEKNSGLGEALTGSASASFEIKKRGAERVLSQLTVGLLVFFLAVSLLINFV